MSKIPASTVRRKPQSFTTKDLDLLRETLTIPHESRTLVFEFLAHTHPEHSMKSWHSFYHKKVNVLGSALTAPNAPPDVFTPEEEEGLIHFLASGGSFMIDTTSLLYNQPFLRSEASWAKFYHSDKARVDHFVSLRRGQGPIPREEHDAAYLDAMLGSTSAQLGVDPSVARYLPNHTLSRVPPPMPEHQQLASAMVDPHNVLQYPHHHISSDGPSTASPSPGAGLEGMGADSNHHHHYHASSGVGTQHDEVPAVPYEHNYPSSSTHPVFHHPHQRHHEYHPTQSTDPSHLNIDPSLRQHALEQHVDLQDTVPGAAGSAHEYELANIPHSRGEVHQPQVEHPQQQINSTRPKKRRRAQRDSEIVKAEPSSSSSSRGKVNKRRKRDTSHDTTSTALMGGDEDPRREEQHESHALATGSGGPMSDNLHLSEAGSDKIQIRSSEVTEEFILTSHSELTLHAPESYLVHT